MKEQRDKYRWLVMALLAMGAFTGVYAQFQLPPVAHKVIPDLGLSPSQFSSVFSAPMLPAIFFSIVAGMMADRFGVKKVIAVGLMIAATGAVLRPLAGSFIMYLICMAMTGCGMAFLGANSAKVIGAWFPPEKISGMLGLFFASTNLAMTVGTGTTAFFPTLNSAYIFAAVIAVAALVMWLLLMKSDPGEKIAQHQPQPILSLLVHAAGSRSVWLAAASMMIMSGAFVGMSGFLPTALQEMRGMDPVAAGFAASVFPIGNLLGSIFGPAVCLKVGRMRVYLVAVGIVAAVGTAFSWLAPAGVAMSAALLATGFAIGSITPLLMSFPMILPEIGPKYAGSAGGLISTLQLLGAVTIPTYIVTPIAGENYYLFFILLAAVWAVFCVVVLMLPELLKPRRIIKKGSEEIICDLKE